MHILFSRFFSYFFSKVIQCAQFACIFESFVTSCHTNGRVWKASFLWQRSLNLIQDVSRTPCTFVRFLCTSQSTSSTDSKLGPGVSSDILMYHRRWGPMSMFRSCRSAEYCHFQTCRLDFTPQPPEMLPRQWRPSGQEETKTECPPTSVLSLRHSQLDTLDTFLSSPWPN